MSYIIESLIFAGIGWLAGYVSGVGVGRRNAEAAHRAICKAARSDRVGL